MTVAGFHQCLADDYHQDPLMGNRAVASFDIDQVVPPSKHCKLCGVGRVPHFQSKFNNVLVWVILTSTFSLKSFKRNQREKD